MQAIFMHGHEFSFGVHNPTGWWISEKFDGVRALWDKTNFISKNGNFFMKNSKFLTLKGKPLSVPNSFKKRLPPDLVLDGELWYGHQEPRWESGGGSWREARGSEERLEGSWREARGRELERS